MPESIALRYVANQSAEWWLRAMLLPLTSFGLTAIWATVLPAPGTW